jgi:hypothetical protein
VPTAQPPACSKSWLTRLVLRNHPHGQGPECQPDRGERPVPEATPPPNVAQPIATSTIPLALAPWSVQISAADYRLGPHAAVRANETGS